MTQPGVGDMAGTGGPRHAVGGGGSAPTGGALEWERVVERQLDPVYRFVLRRVQNPADAEDIAAEVFLRAWRWLHPERAEREVASWLFRTARTVIAEHWRGRAREQDAARRSAAVPGARPEGTRAQQQVAALLAGLPSRYRAVLELRFLESLSVAEVAARLGLRAGNVRTLQYRALREASRLGEGGPRLGRG
jgi:RNA polymerase sigma factor (sigma-70 family)